MKLVDIMVFIKSSERAYFLIEQYSKIFDNRFIKNNDVEAIKSIR